MALLTVTFRETEIHSLMVNPFESTQFNKNTCPRFNTAYLNNQKWNCMRFIKATNKPSCGFCVDHINDRFGWKVSVIVVDTFRPMGLTIKCISYNDR
jgi:hypothetical protein